jgi:outer membrane protein OmpA-like peptidoglycan-associated protein
MGYFFLFVFLCGCAASDVSRDAATNMDMGVDNAKNLVSTDGNISDSYQNATMATKGALLGGAAGGAAGALASGVGFFPGAATGAILGGSYGSYIDSHTSLKDRLENRGGTLVVLGDQILIMVPSARLFDDMTSTLKPQAYSTLQMIAQYVNQYTKILVKVAAYTNNNSSYSTDLALSKQQAQNVAKILLAYGLDGRLVYAEGYGGTHQVERNTQDWNGNANYRIEITLTKLYV